MRIGRDAAGRKTGGVVALTAVLVPSTANRPIWSDGRRSANPLVSFDFFEPSCRIASFKLTGSVVQLRKRGVPNLLSDRELPCISQTITSTGVKKMKKALTSAIVSVAMVLSSVAAIAADTADSKTAVQTGPLSPGGPVVVSPAQGTVDDTLSCGYDIYGICGPIVLLGVAGMGVALAAIMGAFTSNKISSTSTTTGTGG